MLPPVCNCPENPGDKGPDFSCELHGQLHKSYIDMYQDTNQELLDEIKSLKTEVAVLKDFISKECDPAWDHLPPCNRGDITLEQHVKAFVEGQEARIALMREYLLQIRNSVEDNTMIYEWARIAIERDTNRKLFTAMGKELGEAALRAALPTTCCSNIGDSVFKSCDKPALYWYKHNDDICSYCEEHNYQCGEQILFTK